MDVTVCLRLDMTGVRKKFTLGDSSIVHVGNSLRCPELSEGVDADKLPGV